MQKIRSFSLALLLAAATLPAAADDRTDAAIGAGLGGALGAVIGYETGGRNGAILGGALGGAGGAAVATDRDRRHDRHDRHDRSYDDRRYRARDDHRHPHGRGFCPPGQAKKGRC